MASSTSELIQQSDETINEKEAAEISIGMVTTFGVVQFFGVIFAPLNGVVIDSGRLKTRIV